MLHNPIYPELEGDARHWGVGTDGYGQVLVQISDEAANQVRIAVDEHGALALRKSLLAGLTMNGDVVRGTTFTGHGSRNPAERWSVSHTEPGVVHLTLNSPDYGDATVSIPAEVAVQMGFGLASRLVDLAERRANRPSEPKVIYTVTVLTDPRDRALARRNPARELEAVFDQGRGSRTWGWFSSIEEARGALARNDFDMHETIYPIAVIETVEEGIAPDATGAEWFNFDPAARNGQGGYVPAACPEDLQSQIGFSMG